jgi:hypothetical protein
MDQKRSPFKNTSWSLVDLLEAIDEHISRHSIGSWQPEHDLQAPYDYFYHFRHTLRDVYAPGMSGSDRTDLATLLKYIEDARGVNIIQESRQR